MEMSRQKKPKTHARRRRGQTKVSSTLRLTTRPFYIKKSKVAERGQKNAVEEAKLQWMAVWY